MKCIPNNALESGKIYLRLYRGDCRTVYGRTVHGRTVHRVDAFRCSDVEITMDRKLRYICDDNLMLRWVVRYDFGGLELLESSKRPVNGSISHNFGKTTFYELTEEESLLFFVGSSV